MKRCLKTGKTLKAFRARQRVEEGGKIQNLEFTYWAVATTYGHVVRPKSFVTIPDSINLPKNKENIPKGNLR